MIIPKRQSTEEERKIAIDIYTRRIGNYLKMKPQGELTNPVMMKFVNEYYLDIIKNLGNKYNDFKRKTNTSF